MAKLEFIIKGQFQAYGPNNGITFLDFKPTDFMPQETHIIGMIAAGLGIKKTEKLRLAELKDNLQVKIHYLENGDKNNINKIYRDYQTVSPQGTDFGTKKIYRVIGKESNIKYVSALDYAKLEARPEDKDCLPSADGNFNKEAHSKIIKKDYLLNCEFLIEIIGEFSMLEDVRYGLMHPYYPLYLGRKNCLPTKFEVKNIV